MQKILIDTTGQLEMIDITPEVLSCIERSDVREGICVIYCPHTTAGITINESSDPDVRHDLLMSLQDIVKDLEWKHSEGNSPAHVMTSLIGKSQTMVIHDGSLVLGKWDGIFLCEFDGPKSREIVVQIIKA